MHEKSSSGQEKAETFPPTQPLNDEYQQGQRIKIPVRYQAGALCPECRQGILDYDGLLNLVCPVCGQGQGGCFT